MGVTARTCEVICEEEVTDDIKSAKVPSFKDLAIAMDKLCGCTTTTVKDCFVEWLDVDSLEKKWMRRQELG